MPLWCAVFRVSHSSLLYITEICHLASGMSLKQTTWVVPVSDSFRLRVLGYFACFLKHYFFWKITLIKRYREKISVFWPEPMTSKSQYLQIPIKVSFTSLYTTIIFFLVLLLEQWDRLHTFKGKLSIFKSNRSQLYELLGVNENFEYRFL